MTNLSCFVSLKQVTVGCVRKNDLQTTCLDLYQYDRAEGDVAFNYAFFERDCMPV